MDTEPTPARSPFGWRSEPKLEIPNPNARIVFIAAVHVENGHTFGTKHQRDIGRNFVGDRAIGRLKAAKLRD